MILAFGGVQPVDLNFTPAPDHCRIDYYFMNRYRKYITSTVGFTFLVVGVTGVIFQFFFKNPVLEHIHGWLGVAMVVAASLHMLQNWQPLQKYMRDGRVRLLIIPVVAVIALAAFGPFAFGSQKSRREGNFNPREVLGKLAQANATDVAKVFGKDVNAIFGQMQSDGLQTTSPTQSIQELARQNHRSPEGIFPYFLK